MKSREDYHRLSNHGVRIGIALVGCGNIAEFRHLPAIVSEVPEFELKVLCNRSEAKLNMLGERYRIPRSERYLDFRQVLQREDVDAILIAASPAANFEIVPEAAKARKHVFVEKPIAETIEQARTIGESVESAGIKFQVGFNKRYYYAYRKVFEMLQNGSVGNPTGISVRFWFPPSRSAISALKQVVMQNGIHLLDLVQYFLGPASEVFAYVHALENRATVTATIKFQSGAVGNVTLSSFGSWSYPNERVDVVGSNGCCLMAENGRRTILFVPEKPSLKFEETISGHWVTGHEEAGFSLQLKAFARSIQSDLPTEVGFRDGLRSLLLADAIEKSLETHQPTTVQQVT